MRLTEYTIEVERTQRQTVTLVVDLDAVPHSGGLTTIAVGHCHEGKWSEPIYDHGNLTSKPVNLTFEAIKEDLDNLRDSDGQPI